MIEREKNEIEKSFKLLLLAGDLDVIESLQQDSQFDITLLNSSESVLAELAECSPVCQQQQVIESVDGDARQRARLSDALIISIQGLDADANEFMAEIKAVTGNNDFVVLVAANTATKASLKDPLCPNIVADVVQWMDAGADDFIVFPIAPTLLREKIKALQRTQTVQAKSRMQSQQIADNHQHLLVEQRLAKEVFDRVTHGGAVDIANIRQWLSPIAVFNGDVFLAAPTPKGNLILLLGDFTGHGLAAAIGVIPLASTFYSMVEKGFSMVDIIKELNSKLCATLPVSVFCCVCVAQFDFAAGSIDVWNAGLPDAYILRKGRKSLEPIASSALALGIVSGSSFTVKPQHHDMTAGDRLYLLSDGVLEAENRESIALGEARLVEALHGVIDLDEQLSFTGLQNYITDFIGDSVRADDISMVQIEMVAEEDFAAMHTANLGHSFQGPVSWQYRYQANADSLRTQDPVPLLLHLLMEVPSLRPYSGQLFTIVSELYNNALDHGVLEIASEIKHRTNGFEEYYQLRQAALSKLETGFVVFDLQYDGDNDSGVLNIDVKDSGKGFDISITSNENNKLNQLHGRGIALLRSVSDQVTYIGNGNQVKVTFCWPPKS